MRARVATTRRRGTSCSRSSRTRSSPLYLPHISPTSPPHLRHISATSPIITHQGRTAEGGHYVAWVKKDKATWLVFDDETVAEIPADRIKELYGGGDWHMAYMCFYRKMDGLTLD